MKDLKTNKNIEEAVNLQVSVALKKNNRARRNGELKRLLDINSRDFSTRITPRYEQMPPLPDSLPKPEFSDASEKVLLERYVKKNGSREHIETIAERFWAVAYDVASAEFDFGAGIKQVHAKAVEFYKLLVSQKFEPNSPTLMNAGKGNGLQYSACFVLPIGDSMDEIFSTVKDTALIHQSGGGTGFSFSRLRPKGSPVKTTGGIASGPVSFLRVLNASTESVKQGGTRRGANMGILRIDHPDILEFIRCKSELDEYNKPVYDTISSSVPEDMRPYFKQLLLDRQISNFNISVALTDKFMDAYFKGENYDLVSPHNGEIVGSLNAKEVFDEIVERAWRNGDPGVVFIDRINNSPANPLPLIDTIESTNPCGEQPLAPYDSCNLGSINLGKYVLENGSIDWEGLKETTWLAVNFLDNVVQVSPFGLEQVYNKVHENRRIGLGVMGWADMLFGLKVPYDSEEALGLAEKVMDFINTEARLASRQLAKERGAFPMFPFSIYKDDKPVRNSAITTIAPTGTISIIADCSSGIEPVFALAFKHMAHGADNQPRKLIIANNVFESIAKREGFYCEVLMEKVMENGTVTGLEEVPEDWQKVFVTAQEIDPVWHVKMQAAFQKYTDNGVSKTVNLKNDATKEDVEKVYLLAWETGCKGITIYRDGSKSVQILNIASSLEQKSRAVVETGSVEISRAVVAARPMILRGRTYKINTPVGKAFITINRNNEDEPFETFITIGRAGMHTAADAEAMGRMISLALRIADGNRVEIAQEIVMQLGGIGGSSHIGFGKDRVMSLADAIAKVLAEELSQIKTTQPSQPQTEALPLDLTLLPAENRVAQEEMVVSKAAKTKVADLCPECGQATFTFEEGCKKCHSCGYSMC